MYRHPVVVVALLGLMGMVRMAAGAPQGNTEEAFASARAEIRLARALEADANRVLGLTHSRVVRVGLPDRVEQAGLFTIRTADGETIDIELEPHSIRGERFEVRLMHGDTEFTLFDPGPPTTVRGRVFGEAGRLVAGSVEEGEIRAVIRDAGGRRMFIEPMWGRSDGADIDHHVLYDEADLIPHGGTCVTLGEQVRHREDGERGGGTIIECDKSVCVADLAVDADHDYLLAHFNEEGVVSQIERVINTINLQYEADLSIRHALQSVLIRMEPFYTQTDSSRLLTTFRGKWLTNHADIDRDIAHLFTGKEVDGNVIGIAWLGVICHPDLGFGLSQSDCCGTFAAATDLTAHELGHNWNAGHCTCVGWTMNPYLTVANRFHPDFTVPEVRRFRTGLDCLSSGAPRITELPFFDNFEAGFIDRGMWTTVRGAGVNAEGLHEPSGDYSANLDGMEQLASVGLDTSISMDLVFEYWWQREGLSDAPEAGDDLFVEYLGPEGLNDWIELRRHPGDGPDIQGFTRERIELPIDAEHTSFRVRFRTVSHLIADNGRPVSNDGFDDWFVDNVLITGDPAVPQAFDLLSPEDGSVAVDLPVRFRWGASERATSYVIEVSESETFFPIAFRATQGQTSLLIEDDLLAEKRYYWRVKATNPRGEATSETGTFVTTLGFPGVFDGISPLSGSIVEQRRPLLEWQSSAGAARYDLVVARDAQFNDPVVTHFQFATPGASTESFRVPGEQLSNSTAYYWKLSATNIAGETPWQSVIRVFMTAWTCLGDADGDGVVSVDDLSRVIIRIATDDALADVNNDGVVNANDISFVLFRLGECR